MQSPKGHLMQKYFTKNRRKVYAVKSLPLITLSGDNAHDKGQCETRRRAVVTCAAAMDGQKTARTLVRRPEVLKKLNADNLLAIERGLLGDLPDRLKPPVGPVRGRPNDLTLVTKPTSLLSSCLPVIPDSPSPGVTSSDDESRSPLKKSFSFRNKFSRISFLGKRDKPKWKAIVEDDKNTVKEDAEHHADDKFGTKSEQDHKSNKRFWFFRNKEIERRERPSIPAYKRSKSFEFLPRALDEEDEDPISTKKLVKNSRSYIFGSSDTMGDAWTSNESLEFLSPKIICDDDVLHCIRENEPSGSSKDCGSSVSTVNSTNSSGIIIPDILKRGSVQDLLDEFDKTVELFSESYLSDTEPYTKTEAEKLRDKRKSSSFSTLPSPKIVQMNPMKVSEVSEDFKRELSVMLSDKRRSEVKVKGRGARRGSVTDWFVLEEKGDDNKYRRALKKPTNRVRRMSSTKYWITPEECAVYSREQRPPLVIPRITQFRPRHAGGHAYPEEVYPEPKPRTYDHRLDSSPRSERGIHIERPLVKDVQNYGLNKRLGGSTENLLNNLRRPNHLQLPASSSGDSLNDTQVRHPERGSKVPRPRKSRSMIAPMQMKQSPVPAPRIHQPAEAAVVFEGPIKRTKFSENGKKCKKNWMDCYMLLTQTALVFYKDQRTYHASKLPKPAGTPPSPPAPPADMVLSLQNAHVIQCIQQHTRRFQRSLLLSVDYDRYLLQDDSEDGAKRWLHRIQNIIYKLGPPTIEGFSTPHYQSSSTDLESLGRTPPVARHNKGKQKGGSSNEDLFESTEGSIKKSHVTSRLLKFFARRPPMEVLVKKGIYKDEPVFGQNLEKVCPLESPRVPDFVVECIREIEGSEENMCTDGLYRASGNLSQVQKIRLEIDQKNLSVIRNNPDIHVLTGSLKLFFRELKEPLIPCSVFDRVLAACSIKPKEARTREFRDIVQSLPQCNRETLKFLLEHLLRVVQYSEKNRMHTANLAIVFGPTLLWAPAAQAHNIAVDCIQQNNVVDILLTDFKEIFQDERKKK